MPQNRLFNPFYESMRLAIPLVINQRNLEGQAQLRQKMLDAAREQATQETMRDAIKFKGEQDKATSTLIQKQLEGAIQSGDAPTYRGLAPQFEKASGIKLPMETQEGGLERYVMPLAKGDKQFEGLSGDAANLATIKGRMPTEQELLQYRASGKQPINVGMNMPAQETEFRKTAGKGYGEEYLSMQKASQDAQVNIARLSNAESLVTRINTGKFKPAQAEVSAAFKGLGVDPAKLGFTDDVGLTQALKAAGMDLTMDSIQRTKGAVSEKEMELFAEMAPNLSNTREGNLLIIKMAKRLNKNKIQVAKMARDYMKKHKTFDEGFQDELNVFYEKNPLFSEDIYSEVAKLSGAATEAGKRGLTATPQVDFSKMSDDELYKAAGIK